MSKYDSICKCMSKFKMNQHVFESVWVNMILFENVQLIKSFVNLIFFNQFANVRELIKSN